MGTHPIFESDFDCLTEGKWMPRVMAEDELRRLAYDYRQLQNSWKDENENFIKFQLIANRDLQLAHHVLTEKQKTDLSVLKLTVREKSKSCDSSGISPDISPNDLEKFEVKKSILIPEFEYLQLNEKLKSARDSLT